MATMGLTDASACLHSRFAAPPATPRARGLTLDNKFCARQMSFRSAAACPPMTPRRSSADRCGASTRAEAATLSAPQGCAPARPSLKSRRQLQSPLTLATPAPTAAPQNGRPSTAAAQHKGHDEGLEKDTCIEIRAGGVRTSIPLTFPPSLPSSFPLSPTMPLTPSQFSAFAVSLSLEFPISLRDFLLPVAVSLSLSLSPYSQDTSTWTGSFETAVEISVGGAYHQFPFSLPACLPSDGSPSYLPQLALAMAAMAGFFFVKGRMERSGK